MTIGVVSAVASSWGRLGTITLLLIFGSQYTGGGKLLLFILSDVLLVAGAVAVLIRGPSTRGKSLEDAARGTNQPPADVGVTRSAPTG